MSRLTLTGAGGGGAAAGLTYEGAYINRSGETGASNKTISLKFTEAVPAGDYTAGMTIEVTADNRSSYETLDLSETTQAVRDTYYVQYTLTGTVDTFQGLDGTTGHQVKISATAGSFCGEITDDTTLDNNSTVNLLDLFTHGYLLNEANATDTAVDTIGSLDMTAVNDPASITPGGVPAGLGTRVRDFTRSSSQRFTLGNNADFQQDATKSYGVFVWVNMDTEVASADQYVISKAISNFEWAVYFNNASGADRFGFFIGPGTGGGVQVENADNFGSPDEDTWYMIAGWYDPASSGTVNISINDESVDSEARSITIGTNTVNIEIGAVNSGDHTWGGPMSNLYWFKADAAPSAAEISDFYNPDESDVGRGKQWPFLPDYT